MALYAVLAYFVAIAFALVVAGCRGRLRVWLHVREEPRPALYHPPDPPDMEWFEDHTLEVEVLPGPRSDD